jgi:septation ring formation regulator EzrA
MNQEIIKGDWQSIKNEIQKTWVNLTNDDLEKSNRKMSSISELIQKKYDHKKNDIAGKLNLITSNHDTNRKDIESIMRALGLTL